MRFYCSLLPYLIAGLLLANPVSADSSEPNHQLLAKSADVQPLITFSLGPDFIKHGRAQTLSLYPPFENYYTNKKSAATVIDGGIFVGIERALADKIHLQYGVAGYTDATLNPQGDVWLFGSPLFDTLTYQYKVRHSRLLAEGKFLFDTQYSQTLHPYFSWNLGAAFNKASDYNETPLVAGAVPTQPFNNHTQTAFTWGAGVGVDASVSKNIKVGAGYQFSDFGSVSLGRTSSANTFQTLSFPHLYANQLRLQLSLLK